VVKSSFGDVASTRRRSLRHHKNRRRCCPAPAATVALHNHTYGLCGGGTLAGSMPAPDVGGYVVFKNSFGDGAMSHGMTLYYSSSSRGRGHAAARARRGTCVLDGEAWRKTLVKDALGHGMTLYYSSPVLPLPQMQSCGVPSPHLRKPEDGFLRRRRSQRMQARGPMSKRRDPTVTSSPKCLHLLMQALLAATLKRRGWGPAAPAPLYICKNLGLADVMTA
jgi:hypothetical protein